MIKTHLSTQTEHDWPFLGPGEEKQIVPPPQLSYQLVTPRVQYLILNTVVYGTSKNVSFGVCMR